MSTIERLEVILLKDLSPLHLVPVVRDLLSAGVRSLMNDKLSHQRTSPVTDMATEEVSMTEEPTSG